MRRTQLSQPITSIRAYRPTLSKIWSTLGLEIREGMRRATIPFERLDAGRQLLLMRVAGVAIELLMKGEFKRVGKDAFLFVAEPGDQENRPAPLQLLSSESTSGELSSYEQAWRKVHTTMKDVEVAMRSDLQTARQMRQILLGANPTPEKIKQIDGLFREQGYLLPENVI